MREILVARTEDLPPGGRKLAFIDGRSLVVFNIDGEFHAIDNECPHQGASVASGKLEGRILRCPAHGLRFDVTTGCMPGTGGLCLKKLPLEVRDGGLIVTIKDAFAAGAPLE
ncbi:3-phenylpropionate/trans-cinnamate dioxygenase ferredoxin subunit [Variovorax sp. HW608]|jgi:3-phenylpropionate/trans-cinnamate dioxygenase ferredoxin subunit|uniref:Rieske (2Fe-2S) protein n=1 Tax=Variovorax sp. HW608 TaxID=1034889 RepID=UPI0008201B75|nr:Rieske (2Fe-2S) protein [Variovorax sp. HW608]SCK37539.1 3-phenylpropionate/trans-cinnamate dioxygenase ferredoxin subunit [Variovorax sp. HW608]